MNPIPNSPYKEAIRKRYETQAANEESQINTKLNRDIYAIQRDSMKKMKDMKHQEVPAGAFCIGLAIGIGFFIAIFAPLFHVGYFKGFIFGAFLGMSLYLYWCYRIKTKNADMDACKLRIESETEDKIQKLRKKAASQIYAVYAEADQKTQRDIVQYDADVKKNCQAILRKADAFEIMVNHVVNMFQRMVSHADTASNRKFIETYFIYRVELYGICYKYQSTYSNPNDNFNFDKERYRNLTTKEECEGLAQAIAKMTISKMKGLYPPNSLNITVNHIDAEVTLHFKAANKNYIPPRDIYS